MATKTKARKPIVSKSASAVILTPDGKNIAKAIFARTRTPAFRRYLTDLLVELCKFNTTPNPDVSVMRSAEAGCFDVLERELNALSFSQAGARTERRAINPAIQSHPNYSLLHFTKTAQRPSGLSPEEAYKGRANLLYFIPGAGGAKQGQSIAANAHLDVVAPWSAPSVKNGIVFGRGACDDKGPAVAILAALKILSEVMPQAGVRWNKNFVGMFVVEEETGGNGSLSLAIDRELKKSYDSIIVNECTGLNIYPANRGAVWYKADLKPLEGVSLFEMFSFINEEMEKEGNSIRAESRHPLFPQRPVQTCHGIIGPFGEHPSRICGHVSFLIQFDKKPGHQTETLIKDSLEFGLASYVGLYGDKTAVIEKTTGKPMVARHYDFKRKANGFVVEVYGATGHMGSIRERDGAITKTAHLVRSLVYSRAAIDRSAGNSMRIELGGKTTARGLILEGGQGFIPTHTINDVMSRMRRAAERGAENYLRRIGRAESGADVLKVAYEKLHNVAFDGDPDSPSMRNAIAAAKASGIWKNQPVLGWTVSCDSRLFATEYPGMDVLTFGPGELAFAHSDQEQIDVDHIRSAAEFLALFFLRQTGSAKV